MSVFFSIQGSTQGSTHTHTSDPPAIIFSWLGWSCVASPRLMALLASARLLALMAVMALVAVMMKGTIMTCLRR